MAILGRDTTALNTISTEGYIWLLVCPTFTTVGQQATKISAYLAASTIHKAKGVIYNASTLDLVGATNEVSVPTGSLSWIDFSFSSPVALPTGTTYALGVYCETLSGVMFIAYDAWNAGYYSAYKAAQPYPTVPDPLPAPATSTDDICTYVTYSSSAVEHSYTGGVQLHLTLSSSTSSAPEGTTYSYSGAVSLSLLMNDETTQNSAAFTTINAELFDTLDTDVGYAYGGGWLLWTVGSISNTVNFPMPGEYRFRIRAAGSFGGNYYPNLSVMVDGRQISNISIESAYPTFANYDSDTAAYIISLDTKRNISAGNHVITLCYTNDFNDYAGGDRNILIDTVAISLLKTYGSRYVEDVPDIHLADAAADNGILIGTKYDRAAWEADATYRQVMADEFNIITPSNDFKASVISTGWDTYNWTNADNFVARCEANGQTIRGHVLVWWNSVPSWLSGGSYTNAQWEEWMLLHIRTIMTRYKGRIKYWDVTNECFSPTGVRKTADDPWYVHVGPTYIEKSFIAAKAADKNAKLFYNDYYTEETNDKSDAIYAMVQDFQARGIPIDGVGSQFHLEWKSDRNKNSMKENKKRITALGLEYHLTEMDVVLPIDEDGLATEYMLNLQAEYYRATIEALVTTPNANCLCFWGITDLYSEREYYYPGVKGAEYILYKDYTKKPGYYEIQRALYEGQIFYHYYTGSIGITLTPSHTAHRAYGYVGNVGLSLTLSSTIDPTLSYLYAGDVFMEFNWDSEVVRVRKKVPPKFFNRYHQYSLRKGQWNRN